MKVRRDSSMHLVYLHYLYGGDTALHHVRQFTRAARGLGHRVDLHALNLGPPPGPAQGAAPRLRQALKRRFGRYLHEPKELAWNLRYARRERVLLAAARPDVLLVRDNLLTASFVRVARQLGLPLVIEVNSPAAESRLYLDAYLHLPLVPERLEGWKLRRAGAVTVVSSALRDHLATRHRLPAERFTVVPNGADLDLFHPAIPPDPELAAEGGPVVGFVGSFQRWHGSELLAALVNGVAAARPEVRFLLVGDGPELEPVRRSTAAFAGRVTATGRVPHRRVPGLVAAFDVAVMPESNFYGSPLKVIEWMAAGKAVVAPAYGPLEDVIDHEVHGLLFPPGDASALVAAVTRLVDDPGRRRSLGQAAAERARGSLSWRDNARRVLAACERARERQAAHRHARAPEAAAGRGRS